MIIIAAFLVAALMVGIWIHNAPAGYEDSGGFHLGDKDERETMKKNLLHLLPKRKVFTVPCDHDRGAPKPQQPLDPNRFHGDGTPEQITPGMEKQKELRERLKRTADGLEDFTKSLLKDDEKVRNRKRDE